MEPLPHDITELMVQCFGRCFYYKDGVTAFLISSDVNAAMVAKHAGFAKFVWARNILTELSTSNDGRLIQRKILTNLCNLRTISDPGIVDKAGALECLRRLKEAAVERQLVKQKVREDEKARLQIGEAKARLVQERAEKLRQLRDLFAQSFTEKNRQKAGYNLEYLLKELFPLFDLEFNKSYRTETSQIDGHFKFEGADYLVEAKWRGDFPTQKDIGSFKDEVSRKLDGTRGLFISVVGFRPEVAELFNEPGARIILFDGQHLMHVLEGRAELQDALRYVIEQAAQRGVVYSQLQL